MRKTFLIVVKEICDALNATTRWVPGEHGTDLRVDIGLPLAPAQ